MVLWNVGEIRRFPYPEKELISSQLQNLELQPSKVSKFS